MPSSLFHFSGRSVSSELSRAKVDRYRCAHEFERGHRRRPAAARIFAIQHSILARPAFKQWWAEIFPVACQRSTYVLLSSLILLLLFWQWRPIRPPSGRSMELRPGFRSASIGSAGRSCCLDLHDRSFRSVRSAPGFLRAARAEFAQSIVQDAPALQNRAASAHAGLSARILGHA